MSLHFLDQTPEPPAIDAQITAQAMDHTRRSRRPLLDDLRAILNQRCPRCQSWLTDESRCGQCGRHSE